MSKIALMAILLAGTATFAATAPPAQARGGETIKVSQSPRVGSYLTDQDGRSIYMFLADSKMESTCHGKCAEEWPPVTVDSKASAGRGVTASKLSTIKRNDGRMQVTYYGHPLYYYEKDKKPGDAYGEDIKDFGEEWYLVSPQGQEAKEKHEGSNY